VTGCEDLLARYIDTQRDALHCRPVADNQVLIVTPHTFADGDYLELLAIFYTDDRLVISDFASVAGRLGLVDVSVDKKRVFYEMQHIAKGYGVEVFDDELRVHGFASEAGDMMLRLIGAMQQVDALQALRAEPRGPRFARRLVSWLAEQRVGEVVPRPRLPGRSGYVYQVTAAVGTEFPIYVQAVTRGTTEDTRSLDHTYRVFADADGTLQPRQKLAVLGESERGFVSEEVQLLTQVCYVGAWWSPDPISRFLTGEISEDKKLFPSVAQGQFDEG
jgi:Domain of unknown function DUF1828